MLAAVQGPSATRGGGATGQCLSPCEPLGMGRKILAHSEAAPMPSAPLHSTRSSGTNSGSDLVANRLRPPSWLRKVLWLLFGLWWVFAAIFVVRSWLMRKMHQRTQEIVAAGKVSALLPEPAHSERLQPAGGTVVEPASRPGTPVKTLPLIGPILAGDVAAYEALRLEMDELGVLANTLKFRPGRILSFKAALAQLGMTGADALSEEEAAAEFIRRAKRFDGLLEKWKEALALGPWDFSGVDLWKPPSAHAGEPGSILLLRLAKLT